MLVEEYRLHRELFGPGRFLLFPVGIALVVAGGVWLLGLTGTSLATIVAGFHALVFFFGLQVGTIGLVGRDAMRDLLGEITLLVFSARTLPLSRRQLLGVFILKDIVYYVGFFLTPVVVGLVPIAVAGGFSPVEVGLLWLSVTGTFALGTGLSLTLAGIGTRSKAVLAIVLAALAAGLLLAPAVTVDLTPYGVYTDPSLASAIANTAVLVGVLLAGPILFEPATESSLRRVEPDRFRQVRSLGDVYTARSLLEVIRSSGSVWKVAFSLGVLFAVTALLLDRLAAATALDPSGGIAFGTLLGLGTFTTYNWVTQFDDPREYLRYPTGMAAVFRGKRRAFLILSVPIGIGYLGIAAVWYPIADLLVGAVIFPPVALYVFGLTAYLTGFSPNELLFDTPMFALYGAGLAVLSVPLLVAALAYGEFPLRANTVSVALAAIAGLAGLVLARRAPSRWHEHLRTE